MKVLVTDHVFGSLEIERSVLEPMGCDVVLADDPTEDSLAALVSDGVDAMLVCYAQVTENVVDAASEGGCRVISRYGVGYDNIDVQAATARGIRVTYVPDYCIEEVADHAMALLLALARGAYPAALSVRDGDWRVPHGTVHRMRGSRLALVGVGAIGRAVLARARAFGIDVVGFDPYVDPWDIDAERAETVADAVADADFVSLHVPLTDETRHLVDSGLIIGMQRSPIIINTARGPLVDMEAVADALDAGRLRGVGLDVTEVEPPSPDHRLRRHPRAILTPHMGFYSVEAQDELQRRAAEEVARGLRGEPPERPVNPEEAHRPS